MPINDLIPIIDDRTFADLMVEARTRIPRYTPEWTDFNESDPGMTLVELFAWMSELLVYRMNKVPALNYYKFLELIGFELAPAQPAHVEITFPVQPTYTLPIVTIPMATQVSAESVDDEGPAVFELDRALVAITATLDAVQVNEPPMFKDASAANSDAKTGFAPFGNLARSGAALMLGFKSSLPFPEIELDLAFFVQATSGPVAPATCGGVTAAPLSGTIVWEYWNGSDWMPMALVEDDTAAFTRDGHVRVQLPPSGSIVLDTLGLKTDADRYWIRARLEKSNYQLPPKLLAIRTNTASATQAETISYEILGISDGRPKQVFTTSDSPILESTMVLEVDEGEGFVQWTEVPDPFGSGPDDTHYILNRSTGEVRFGDGIRGRIPVANPANPQNIRATTYRVGGGARGNVGAGTVTSLLGGLQGIAANKIANLFPAGGGADEESLASAKDRAPGVLRTRDRAVTPEDFERLAREVGMARAKALPLRHPDFPTMEVPGVVSVVVVPNVPGDAPTPNPVTLKTVCAYLDARRLLTTELYVVPPRYRTITITATLIAKDDADLASVQETASATLDRFFDPLIGGEDSTLMVAGTGWPFGGGIYYSQVIRRLLVDGVKRIASLTMKLDDDESEPCGDLLIAADELLINGDHQIQVYYEGTTT
jgi:predicted phage baseplate assembly protein